MGAGMALGRFGWRFFIFGTCLAIENDMRGDLFAHLETLSTHYFNEHASWTWSVSSEKARCLTKNFRCITLP